MAVDAIHGNTGSGKSRACEAVALHLAEAGKKTLVYIGDGGEATWNTHGLVDEGMVRLVEFSARQYPMTVLRLMTDFYVPKGWVPTEKLEKPDLGKFYEEFGLIVYEGGGIISTWLNSDTPGGMEWQTAHKTGFGGVKDNEDELNVEDTGADIKAYGEDYTLHGTTTGRHSMIIQRKLLAAIRGTRKFPGLVIWTTHTIPGPDKDAGATTDQYGKIQGKVLLGPDFGGPGPVSVIGKEFGNLMHMDLVAGARKVKDAGTNKEVEFPDNRYRLYTARHKDPNQQVATEYAALTRAPYPKDFPLFFESKEPGDSLLQFYQSLKEQRDRARRKPIGG